MQKDDISLYQNTDTTGSRNFYFEKNNEKLILYHKINSRGKFYSAVAQATPREGESMYFKNFLTYPEDNPYTFSVKEIIGDTAYLFTNWDAPKGKVLFCNINSSNALVELISEKDISLTSINRLGKDKLACIYLSSGQNTALIYNLEGQLLKEINFPKGKRAKHLYERNPNKKKTLFCVSSFYHPNLCYQLDLNDLTFEPVNEVYTPYKAADLETKYVTYTSKDGTPVSMYLTSKKDIEKNGKNPTLIYGYGGYGKIVEPSYDRSKALWLLHGGILAIPNIRGGGAEGTQWSADGRRLKKQNGIDDFISAAEFLIEEKYTRPEKIAINGGSHGGMLVAAAATQRPDLYKAAIVEAGVLDMLRFGNYTAGKAQLNVEEFGTVQDSLDYKNLLSYSPMHKLQPKTQYPNILLMTGTSDDRVPPFHSYKFLATLQEKALNTGLYHIFLTRGAGHGGALTPEDWTNSLLYKYYFLFDELDLQFW